MFLKWCILKIFHSESICVFLPPTRASPHSVFALQTLLLSKQFFSIQKVEHHPWVFLSTPPWLHIQPGSKNNSAPCFTSFLGSSCLSILSAGYMCHSDSLHFSALFLPLSPVFYSRHHHFLPTLWSLWSNYLPLTPPWFRVCSTVALSLKYKHYQYPLAIG